MDTDEFLVGLRELGIMLKKEESDVQTFFRKYFNFINRLYWQHWIGITME